jgi:glycerol-3-phosphate dehydrogenase
VKYTTARSVAEQAVDLAVRSLKIKTKKSQTHIIPVHGGWIGDFNNFMMLALSKTPRDMDEEIIEHLVYTHGTEYQHFLKDAIENPGWAERIDPKLPVIVGEVIHSVRHEMALKLSDIVQRRTELGAAGLPSMDVLQKCAQLAGDELGWSRSDRQREIDCVMQEYPLYNLERVSA